MALLNSFIFDTSKGQTPQSIALQRSIAAQIMGQVGNRPARNAGEGIGNALASIGHGISANVLNRRANSAEEAGMAGANDIKSQLVRAMTQGGTISPMTMPEASGELSATSPGGGGGMEPYRNAIASIESAGSGDYAAVGPKHPKLGRALGRYQVMEANIGPWTEKYLGRRMTPEEFLASPQAQDAVFDGEFGSYVQRFGPEGAAQAWFAGPGGVGKTNRRDSLGTSVADYTQKFSNAIGGQQVASLDPSAAMGAPQAIDAQAAPSGYVDPMVSAPNAMPQPQGIQTAMAPELPAPVDVATPPVPPQQVAQAQGQQQMQGGNVPIELLLEAVSNPFLDDGMKSVANMLLQQHFQSMQPAKPMEVNGRLVDPRTGAVIADYSDPKTATVGNSIIDVRTGQPIYQGQQDPTTGIQEYEYYANQARQSGQEPLPFDQWDIARRREGGTTVNNIMGGNKFGEEFAKGDAQALSSVSEAGLSAQRNMGRIDRLAQILEATPQGAMAAWQQIAGQYGINTKGLDNIQAAQALINSLVPEQRPPGSGPMSDADLELFKQSLPRIINQPGGNQIIINTMRAIAKYDAEGAQIVQGLRRGEVDRAHAFDLLQNRANPLAGLDDISSPVATGAPEGMDPSDWEFMTPEERRLFQQ